MTDLEKEELSKRAAAMTVEELSIIVNFIPNEIMITELEIRLKRMSKILNLIGEAVDLERETENGFI